jgi:DNA polymerase bacteriophage-type
MKVAHVDFETRSKVELTTEGLMRYATDRSTEILCVAWAFDDGPVHVAETIPEELHAHVVAGGVVAAHSAQFEYMIWNYVARGVSGLLSKNMRCTAARCYAMALPGALAYAAKALGIESGKDMGGRALMLSMCKPVKVWPNGEAVWNDTPEKRAQLMAYCAQDVEVEREIYRRTLALSSFEQRIWELDLEINLRGIPFDIPSVNSARILADEAKKKLNEKMKLLTNGEVPACSNIAKLKAWAADRGVMPDTLDRAEVRDLLTEIPAGPVRDVIGLRRDATRFTSVAKLDAIAKRQINGRVAFTFQYHAATTGRWGGRGIQPHNFTRDLPSPEVVEELLDDIRHERSDWIELAHGPLGEIISQCLRGFIQAPERV